MQRGTRLLRLRRVPVEVRQAIAVAALLAAATTTPRAGTVVVFGPTTLTRTTGAPNQFDFTFAVYNPSLPYTLRIDNDGLSSAVVRLNGTQVAGPADFNPGVKVIERSVPVRASNALHVELRSKPGTRLTIRVLGVDTDPPTITAQGQPPANAAGWNSTDVRVTFACADAGSGIASCTPPRTVTTEGRGQIVTGTAVDNAGNTSTASVTLNIDKAPPAIAATISPAPNQAGWNNSDVTVTFTCSDSLSGIGACPPPARISPEGAKQTISGTALDVAGNAASTSVTVSIDKTPPTISASLSPSPNANGWNNSDVVVSFTCGDAGAGIASCPAPITVTREGARQTISGTATDKAGNTAMATVSVNIDKSAPTVTPTVLPPPNAQGWNDTNVSVNFACADGLSGVATCPAPVTVTTEGIGQVISGIAVDAAGNQATASVTLNIDETPLSIAPQVQPAPNAAGWNNTNVTVTFTCQDTGSGVGVCPVDVPVTTEGARQVISGTGSDRAGNQSTASVSVNIDKTPPQITAAVTPMPTAAGWVNRDATVSFACADSGGSGIATCSAPVTLGEGAGQHVVGTAVDAAGNSATATATVSVDKTAPSISYTISPPPNAAGWLDTDATVTFVCSDSGSGIQTCPAAVTVTAEGANQPIAGTAVDNAGNSATATAVLNIDKTRARITASVDPPPNASGWNHTSVVVAFACSDAGSGAIGCPQPVTVATEGAGQVIKRTVADVAGNTSDVSVTLNIDTSPPTVTAVANPASNAGGWNRTDITVSFTCDDSVSGIAACPAPILVSGETAGQTVSGTAVDKAGNTAIASVTVRVDKTPPVVTIASPAPGATPTTSTVALSGSATDALSGIASATCNGAAATVGAGGALNCSPTLVDGQNTLTLSATDAAGNVASSQVNVTFVSNHPPIANPGGGYSGVPGTPINFSAAGSSDPDNDPITFSWNFGDGGTATDGNVAHTYSRAGTYAVTLTVADNRGGISKATTSAIIVQPNRAPTANANGPYAGVTGTAIAFSGTGSDPDNDPIAFSWNFGDGTSAVGSSVSHTYSTPNTYTVTLTVSDGQLTGVSTAAASVAQANRPPTVSAGGPYTGVNGTAVNFAATGSDPDHDPLTYSWDFGDGTTGSGAAIGHTFTSPGTYNVKVTATDGRGGAATASAAATIAQANRPPHANAGGPYAGQAKTRILFSAAASTDPDNDALTYTWDFGDGSTGAGVAPNHGYVAEGSYTVKVTVDDGRGGTDSTTASVSITPAAVAVNQPPVARPGGPYAGDAGVVLTVNGSGSTDPDNDTLTYAWDFGDGATATGASATHVYATSATFTITLSVSDGHGHTTSAATSATIAPPTDRAPPAISLSAPSRVLPGTDVTITATATDNVGVASVSFDVDGAAPTTVTTPPYQRIISVPAVASPGATIVVHATATDAAGNTGTAQATLSIDAVPDTEKPTVTLNVPGRATPSAAIRLTATAGDNVGVASVAFSADGSPIATVPAAPYESIYTIAPDAVVGSIVTFTARATDFTGNYAEATATVGIVQSSDTTPPTVTVSAPSGAAPGAQLKLTADASDAGGVASVSFYVEGVQIASLTAAPYAAAFNVPATATPGSILHLEARADDFSGNEGRATAQAIVVAAGKAIVIGEVYDDSTGLLLSGAGIALVGADRSGVPYSQTDDRGRFVVYAAAGHGVLAITHGGMTRVDRPVDLQDGTAIEVLDTRLTPLAAPTAAVSGVLGGTISGPAGALTVAAGATTGSATFTLTTVSQQGLEGLLPPGWSPVSVIDIAPHGTSIPSSTLAVPNTLQFAAGTTLVAATWDETRSAWRAIADATVSSDGSTIQVAIDATGEYAVLLADAQPSAPAHPSAGDLLAGVSAAIVPADAVSLVSPRPKILFYSPGVKSDVSGRFTSKSPLPSGTVIQSRITESYHFFSGAEIHPEPYTADLVFYQLTTDGTGQGTTYVVSPSLTFEPLTLQNGVITVELLAPPASAAPIAAVGPDGGTLTAPTGESIQVPPGAGTDPIPLEIIGLTSSTLGLPMPDGVDFVGALRLDFTRPFGLPATVSVPVPASLGDTTGIVLVRLHELQGQTRMVLVGVGRVAGDRVVSDVTLVGPAKVFEGVRVPGRYAFVHMQALTAFAAGTIFGTDNAPFAGAMVSTPGLPIVSLSHGGDGYIALGVVGNAAFTARDLVRSDLGNGAVTFANQNDVLPLDLHLVAQPPRVTSILPSDGSLDVSLDTAVVVTFSQSIDPATVNGSNAANIVLTASDGTAVSATLSLSAANSVATLRPAASLQSNTSYTATVSASVAGLSGYLLGTAASATFVSLNTTPPPPPPAGSVTASIPANGQATIRATQGTAGAHDKVTIVNLTTGQITPVLLDPNGGFTTTVAAATKDKLRLRIVDAAGNETALDLPRYSQTNVDGSVSAEVGADGAHVDGPGGTATDIPPGSIPDGTVVTIRPVSESDFGIILTGDQKQIFSYSGGVSLDFGGATPAKYVNVSILPGPDDTAKDEWVVGQLVTVGGVQRMNAVDTAHIINGRITTSSPPCPGVTGSGVYGIYKTKRPVGVAYGQMGPGLTVDVNAFGQLTGTLADMLLLPWASLVTGLDIQAPVCIPVLTGNVTVASNTVLVSIAGTDLTPEDREIVIKNTTKGTEFHYPRDVVEYAFNVQGQADDKFLVTVTTPNGTDQTVNGQFFKVADAGSGTVNLTLNADKIDVPIAKVTITDLTVKPPRVDTFTDTAVNLKFNVAGAGGDTYQVLARDVAQNVRALTPTITPPPPPLDGGNLIAKAVTGTIDPTKDEIDAHNAADPSHPIDDSLGRKDVFIGEAESGASTTPCGVVFCLQITNDQIVHGGFAVAFNGDVTHHWEIKVTYDNGKIDSRMLPSYQLNVRNKLTGKVIRTIPRQAPPQGQPANFGTISGDTTPPLVTSGPPRMNDFDPSSPLTVTFSQPMDPATLVSSTFIVEKQQQNLGWTALDGTVNVSADLMSATFVPSSGLAMGEDYRIRFSGVRSATGQNLLFEQLFFSTFKPHRVCASTANANCGVTFTTPNDAQTSLPIQLKDVEILKKTDPSTGQVKTILVGITSSPDDVKLMTFDVTDPGNPVILGSSFGGARKQRVIVVPNASFSLHDKNPCPGPDAGPASFTGDLAITTTFNTYFSFVSFFDLRDPTHPCLMGNKLLTATPDTLSSYSSQGTVHAFGFARGVAPLTYPNGLVAYTAVGEVGLMSADAGKNIPEQGPFDRQREGEYPGDFWDVVAVGDQLLAVEKTSGNPPGALDLFDSSLNEVMSFSLPDAPRRILYVPGIPVDLNGDGTFTRDEVRNIAFIAGDHSIQYVDVTDPTSPQILGSIQMPGIVRDLQIDTAKHRLYAGGDQTSGGGAQALFVIDIANLKLSGLIDNDGDAAHWDDRILWATKYPGGIGGFRIDNDRGLAYVASTTLGVDVVAVGDICCDVGVDLTREPVEVDKGDRSELLKLEKQALQQGIGAGLGQAAGLCSIPPFGGAVTILEQGSGACIWRGEGDCDTNYQPGLSDHDFEVFIPASFFGGATITRPDHDPETQPQCFTNVINEQFTDFDTGKPIVFELNGKRISFDDITFFPVRKEGFTSANLDILPPTSSGGDPTGDMGLGRQQLLMKWLLEGSYVTVPPSLMGGQTLTHAPEENLDAILSRLTSHTGVPQVEGLEWGVLQEFNLIKSKAYLRVKGSSSTASPFNEFFKKQVHDAAKAGIRAALAQMVAVPRGNQTVLDISKSRYDTGCVAPTPTGGWEDGHKCYSFEEYIASTAVRDFLNGTQFGVAPVFTVNDLQQVYRFFRVKADRTGGTPDADILTNETMTDDFIASVARFIGGVQTDARTIDAYTTGIAADPQAQQRTANMTAAQQARNKALTHGSVKATIRAFNNGFANANGVLVRMFRNAETPGSGMEAKKVPVTLPGGAAGGWQQWLDFKIGVDLPNTNPPQEDPQNPYVDMTTPDGTAHAVAFTIDLPERSVKEPTRQNNWSGFYYYILNRDVVSHTVPAAPDKPPFPLDPALLTPDSMCIDAPKLTTVQEVNNDKVRVTVFNTSGETLTDVTVCSDLAQRCSMPVTIAAHSAAPTIVLAILDAPTSEVAVSKTSVTGKDHNGNTVQIVASEIVTNIASPITVELFDATPLAAVDHPFSRYLLTHNLQAQDVPVHGAVTDGTAKAIRVVATGLKPNQPVTATVADTDFPDTQDGIGELVLGQARGSTVVTNADQLGTAVLYYTPPSFFLRPSLQKYDWDKGNERAVNVTIHQNDVGTTNVALTLRRPPVFLVHGLGGTIDVFDKFQPIVPQDIAAQYFAARKGFDGRFDLFNVGSVHSSHRLPAEVAETQLDIRLALGSYLPGVAIGKIDLIAHSMGGMISRKMTNENAAIRDAVRKLVIINSPLRGSPLADKVVATRDASIINFAKFDLNPIDFWNPEPIDALKDGFKDAIKFNSCYFGIKVLGHNGLLNVFNGAIDDLQTALFDKNGNPTEVYKLKQGGNQVPTHHVVTVMDYPDLAASFAGEVGLLWKALGVFCNWTPDSNTVNTTQLVKVSAAAAKLAVTAGAGAATAEGEGAELNAARTKALLKGLKSSAATAFDSFLGEQPEQIFSDTNNDRIVPLASQLEDLTVGDQTVTYLHGLTDHQEAKISKGLPIPTCIITDPNGVPRINAPPSGVTDLDNDQTPDVACHVINLLELDPKSPFFKQ